MNNKKCTFPCGACCIAPSISSPLPGMPAGKKAGVRCVNLDDALRCLVYDIRPNVCREFVYSVDFCGRSHEEAVKLITLIDDLTRP